MSDDVHRIRLRGPWDYVVVWAADGATREPGRVTMPCDWSASLGADFRGRVRYRRTFNRPTNLAATQPVWLVCEAVHATADVWLNGEPLGRALGDAGARFAIAERLALRNELVVEVEFPPGDSAGATGSSAARAGGLVGEVRLEIGPS